MRGLSWASRRLSGQTQLPRSNGTVLAVKFTSDQYVYITCCSLMPVIKKNSNHNRTSASQTVKSLSSSNSS